MGFIHQLIYMYLNTSLIMLKIFQTMKHIQQYKTYIIIMSVQL